MMTPEEIKQVVEDYRKSSQSLNEKIELGPITIDMGKIRNLRVKESEKVNVNGDKDKKNGNGAQGATNGAQGTQSSTTGSQGAQSNDNVGAQGNGAQSSTTGSQGAQSNDNVGAQGNGAQSSTTGSQGAQSSTTTGAQGGQGTQTNTVKKNEIDQFIRKGKEVTINDFGGIKPTISPAKFSTNQKQSRELVKSGELKDTDLNKYSRSNTYTADDGKTQVTRSTVNTIAQFDMGPNIKKGDKLGVISKNQRKKYDLQVANMNNKVEAYDLVLDYVLSEGHADNIEEAHYVMMQLDEETIKEFIKKAALIGTGGVLAYKGLKKAGDSFNNMLNNLRNNSKLGGNKRVDDVRKNSDDPNVGQKYYFGAQGNKP